MHDSEADQSIEIDHVAKVADALAFTIDQTAKIDEAYLAAFP